MVGAVRRVGCAVLASGALGCGALGCGAPADGGSATTSTSWSLEQDLALGTTDGPGPGSFGYVAALHVDGRERIWVADGPSREIRVFDRDGAFIRAVGRPGQGPGELGVVSALEPGPAHTLWVADGGNGRWTVFDSAGTHVATHPYAPGMYRFGDRWGTDGLLYTWVMSGRTGQQPDFVMVRRRLDPSGLVPVDTLPVPVADPGRVAPVAFERDGQLRTALVPVPFQSVRRRLLVAGSGWWLSHPGPEYRVARLDLEGDTVMVLERDVVEVSVTDQDIVTALDALGPNATLSRDEIPERHPPVGELAILPDGHLLVRRRSPEGEVWDVFSPEGRFVTELDVPGGPRFRLLATTDEALYGVVVDRLDVPRVIRVRIHRHGT